MPFRPRDRQAALRRVEKLPRDLHDASLEYVPPADAVWNIVIPADRCDLIVYHDAAPLEPRPQRRLLGLDRLGHHSTRVEPVAPRVRSAQLQPTRARHFPKRGGATACGASGWVGLDWRSTGRAANLCRPAHLEHVPAVGRWPQQWGRAVRAVVVGWSWRDLAGRREVRRAAPPAVPRGHPQQRVVLAALSGLASAPWVHRPDGPLWCSRSAQAGDHVTWEGGVRRGPPLSIGSTVWLGVMGLS